MSNYFTPIRMCNIHHAIKAVLYPNPLKNNDGTFKAQTLMSQTLGIKDICNSLCNRSMTGVDPNAIEYHVRLFLEEMGELLADGYAINTGYFAAGATIRGSFKHENDKFDAERHSITYKFSQGAVLRKRNAGTKAEILHIRTSIYGFQQVKDSYSGSEYDLITPGGGLKIKGIKMKLTGSHPDVGLYFISETTGERTKVPAVDVITNQNNNLLILIPRLQPGSYRLEHITQYAGKGTPLNEPRSCTLLQILRVI